MQRCSVDLAQQVEEASHFEGFRRTTGLDACACLKIPWLHLLPGFR